MKRYQLNENKYALKEIKVKGIHQNQKEKFELIYSISSFDPLLKMAFYQLYEVMHVYCPAAA